MYADVINFKPFVDGLLVYLGQVAPVIAVALAAWFARYFGFTQLAQSTLLHDGLARAVTYGMARARDVIDAKAPLTVNATNEVLTWALKYALQNLPGIIKEHKLDPADVVHLLMAHLPTVDGEIPHGTAQAIAASVA